MPKQIDIFLPILLWVVMRSHGSVVTSLPMPLKSLVSSPGLEIRAPEELQSNIPPDKFFYLLSCSPLSFAAPVLFSNGITIHVLSCPTRNLSHSASFLISYIRSDTQTYQVQVYICFKLHLNPPASSHHHWTLFRQTLCISAVGSS